MQDGQGHQWISKNIDLAFGSLSLSGDQNVHFHFPPHCASYRNYIGIVHKNEDPNRDLRCQVDGLHASLESSHNTK